MAERRPLPTKAESSTLMVSKAVHRELRVASILENRPLISLTQEALVEWLDRHGYELPEGWEKRGRRIVEVGS